MAARGSPDVPGGGAVFNTVMDPVFIFALHWGVKGAALATILGQLLS
jgi:Na+-driven multidrug efflux pump